MRGSQAIISLSTEGGLGRIEGLGCALAAILGQLPRRAFDSARRADCAVRGGIGVPLQRRHHALENVERVVALAASAANERSERFYRLLGGHVCSFSRTGRKWRYGASEN